MIEQMCSDAHSITLRMIEIRITCVTSRFEYQS